MLEDIITICESFSSSSDIIEKLDELYKTPNIPILRKDPCLFQLIYDEYMIEAADPRELLRYVREWLENADNMPKFREICKSMRIAAYKKYHDIIRSSAKFTDINADMLRTIFANIIGVNIIIQTGGDSIYKLYNTQSDKYILIRWNKSGGYYTPLACYDTFADCDKYITDNKLVMYYDERDINNMGLADLQQLYNRIYGNPAGKMKKAEYISKLVNYFLINN